ncbi:hypothetical protein D3C75_1315450 [compost metagenome]
MLAATMRSMSAGRGGIEVVNWAMKEARSSVRAAFQRFSKPMVEDGLPDRPAPQALPAW